MNFSLIIPCFNEALNLPTFFAAATACLDAEHMDYELVFVDDGSSDDSVAVLRKEVQEYRLSNTGRASVVVVELSRNFGKEAALHAGLEHATGACVGFIDADMQQDPEVALKMLHFLDENPDIDCVAAVQESRKESLPLRACKKMFYKVFNGMSDTRIIADVSDFRVFRRPVAEALISMREQFRFSKGLFAWIGFKTHVMPYQVHQRLSGSSKWTLRKLVSYGWNGVLAFSTWPLKIIMYAGVVLALVSLVFFGLDVVEKMLYNNNVSSTLMLVYVVLLMGGLQMVVLGIFGEYMARAYIEAKNRPIYLARSTFVSEARKQKKPVTHSKVSKVSQLTDENEEPAVDVSGSRAAAVTTDATKKSTATLEPSDDPAADGLCA